MQRLLVLGIFVVGMVIGSIGLLFWRVVEAHGVVSALLAQSVTSTPTASPSPTPLPFICLSSCIISNSANDYSGPGFGNRFAGKDLSNAYIDSLNSQGGIDFSHVNFTNAWLYHLYTDGDNWQGANFTNAWMYGANLGSNFTNANFTNANLTWAVLRGNFTGATFTNTNFSHADLSNGTFAGATFRGVVWLNTACGDGTNSDNNNNTCSGHLRR